MCQQNECSKCGKPEIVRGIWCGECLVLMGRRGPAIPEARRRELGIYVTPLDKQILEPIPHVMDVEHWPELFHPAKPSVSCYNRVVTQPPC